MTKDFKLIAHEKTLASVPSLEKDIRPQRYKSL
jgi:hypothetical protein